MVEATMDLAPRRRARVSQRVLLVAAAVSIAAWAATETYWRGLTHPMHTEMARAARTMEAASRVILAEKTARGLVQPPALDPNRTGLIGPEWSEITTTLGILEAKRTATNPDLAAALVRSLSQLALKPGDVAVVALSGSLVGANLAALAAVEALRLKPVVISSLAASMYGATDPTFTWGDMETAVRSAGVISSRSAVLVAGGVGGAARDLAPDAREMLRAAARRHGGEYLDAQTPAELQRLLLAALERLTGSLDEVRVFINAGGAQIVLGDCPEGAAYPNGLVKRALPCSGEVPGLLAEFSRRGTPVLHILNMRRLAADWGLPYDPAGAHLIGDNVRVYGAPPRFAAGEGS
jgi:poly-gamma-glutamate system protein